MPKITGLIDYERVRRYLRYIYLYGFLSRSDFAKLKIGSVNDYDSMSALIRAIFPEIDENAQRINRKKYLSFQRVYARSGSNRMTDSYMLYSLDANTELPILLMMLMAVQKRQCGLKDIQKFVELNWDGNDKQLYSYIRDRAEEMTGHKYLQKEKHLFSLSEDVLQKLQNDQLLQLYDYINFLSGICHPRTPGSFLRRTIERELLRRSCEYQEESPLLLRHAVNSNVFDEDVLYELLSAISDKKYVEVRIKKEKRTVLPICLRIDTRLGRWYLLYMDNAPEIVRLSDIHVVKGKEAVEAPIWTQAEQQVKNVFLYSGVSGWVPPTGPVLVEARLDFRSMPEMRMQFERELRIGSIIHSNGGDIYRVWINDPNELIPFLRSFSPWVQILPGKHHLQDKIKEGLLQMRLALEKEDGHEIAE